MKRNYSLDLMRVFLCLCVIAIHSMTYIDFGGDLANSIFMSFLAQANGVFYMISGYFNLEKEFNNSTDIKKYYKNKIIYILLPFIAFLFVWALWDYLHVNPTFDIKDFLSSFYKLFMEDASEGHMWFMYPLFGLLLSTPFLSKMLHNMDNKELKILWRIALGWNIVCYFLCYNLDINFRFLGWLLSGWIIYYFAGYYYRHVVVNESKTKWLILGLAGFIATVVGINYLDRFDAAEDLQPLFTLFCMGCLVFFDKCITIKNEKISKIFVFLSKNTFLIYLFHLRAMEFVVRKLAITGASPINSLLVVFGTFIAALLAAVITNLLLKPIQKLIDKVWTIK